MSTWNPSDKTASITLSAGNLTASVTTTAQSGIRGTASYSTGKLYAEFTTTTVTANDGWGIATASWSESSAVGMGGDTTSMANSNGGVVFCNNVQIGSTIASVPSGTVLCMALDIPNNKVYFRVNAGNWNNSVPANPATNTGGITMTGLAAGPYFLAHGTVSSTTTVVSLNAGSKPFAQTMPATFLPWDPHPTVVDRLPPIQIWDR